ncbi:hypothetical protein OFB93_29030, partial [Escherichia coli]|nr:hypothetical protein [Escherichia coli]
MAIATVVMLAVVPARANAEVPPTPASTASEPTKPLPEATSPIGACDAREAEELRAHLVTERRK